MKAGHMEIFVKDTLKSKDFYINVLGFKLIEIQREKFVWLESGNSVFLLRPNEDMSDNKSAHYGKTKIGIVLYTENLDNTVKELRSRGFEFKGTDGSERCLTFTDPDGNWFQLVNPDEH